MNESGSTNNTKQQIVEKIQASNNILVTVSDSPSVDELSAALGLTILLNNMKKHATAVFSGTIPRAIDFLEPGKTFENSVDSLRDFIIALDKEKADHLSYKVDGEIVKISITPYRTTITSKDLEFSQGDYNIEMVLALGVRSKSQLDRALEAHGRILHDASVVSIVRGEARSELGSIGWRDQSASSLCEMIVGLSEQLKTDAAKLDEQTATALLTGIVSATERFSNNLTSSKTMTFAAKLMQAGANQQLIASNLAMPEHTQSNDNKSQPADSSKKADNAEKADKSETSSDSSDGTAKDDSKVSSNDEKPSVGDTPNGQDKSAKSDHSALSTQSDVPYPVSHEKSGDLDSVWAQTTAENQSAATQAAEDNLSALTAQATSAAPTIDELQRDMAGQLAANDATTEDSDKNDSHDSHESDNSDSEKPAQTSKKSRSRKHQSDATQDQLKGTPLPAPMALSGAVSRDLWEKIPDDAEPSMGGILNATTDQAAADSKRLLNDTHNKTILSHSDEPSSSGPSFVAPPSFQPIDPALLLNDSSSAESYNDFGFTDGLKDGAGDYSESPTAKNDTIKPLNSGPKAGNTPEQMSAIEAALQAAEASASDGKEIITPLGDTVQSPNLANNMSVPPAPMDLNLPLPPMPPPLPDFSGAPMTPPSNDAASEPEHLGDILAPPLQTSDASSSDVSDLSVVSVPTSPGQFKIPGQN